MLLLIGSSFKSSEIEPIPATVTGKQLPTVPCRASPGASYVLGLCVDVICQKTVDDPVIFLFED